MWEGRGREGDEVSVTENDEKDHLDRRRPEVQRQEVIARERGEEVCPDEQIPCR